MSWLSALCHRLCSHFAAALNPHHTNHRRSSPDPAAVALSAAAAAGPPPNAAPAPAPDPAALSASSSQSSASSPSQRKRSPRSVSVTSSLSTASSSGSTAVVPAAAAAAPAPSLPFRFRGPASAAARAPRARARDADKFNLLALPDDVLHDIFRHATHCPHNQRSPGVLHVVEHRSYLASCALAEVSRKTSALFFASLDNVCLASAPVADPAVDALSRRAGPALRRLVLRGSSNLSDDALRSLARNAPQLRSLDLSFLPSVSADGLAPLCAALSTSLRHLLLRKCTRVNDAALRAIAACTRLETLDLSYCARVTDRGVEALLEGGAGASLRLLAVAHNALLTDASLIAIGKHCTQLVQLCARGLPVVTDHGFERLCAGVGPGVEGIDVTLCPSLTRDATLHTLGRYCPKIYVHIMAKFATRSLQQIIISTLRQNIFIVHGSDPMTGKNTVHTVLIDNGDLVSASLLTSGTTDLSMLGIVLCKSYGSSLTEETKQSLEKDYGIPRSIL